MEYIGELRAATHASVRPFFYRIWTPAFFFSALTR